MAIKPYFVGITGGSGAGKTTFLSKLVNGYSSDQVSVLSMDNYYKPRAQQLYDENGVQNFDLVESFETERMLQDLQAICNGGSVELDEYDYNNNQAEKHKIVIKDAPVLIIEGLFIMHIPEVRDLLNLKVYVEAKDGIKIIRRIKRDQFERNYPIDDVLYRYEAHVLPSYERFILPYKHDVDIIVNNNTHTDEVVSIIHAYFDKIIANQASS